jgi:hypothetical protein
VARLRRLPRLSWLPWLPSCACLQVRWLRGLWRLLPVLGTVPLVLGSATYGCSITARTIARNSPDGSSSSSTESPRGRDRCRLLGEFWK